MGKLIFIIIGYILAASVSDSVSFDLTQTEWSNIWTYALIVVSTITSWLTVLSFLSGCLLLIKYLEKKGY
jgi:hypothetical protein